MPTDGLQYCLMLAVQTANVVKTILKVQYVDHRVRQMQELTSVDWWHYVRSEQNPADCAVVVTPSE